MDVRLSKAERIKLANDHFAKRSPPTVQGSNQMQFRQSRPYQLRVY
jgi:hypothetical protein